MRVYTTDWFTLENHYLEGMVVINNASQTYYNGYGWLDIEEDHL